jgi:uncharacterized protein YbjT (DUF2867 family)
MNPQLILVTGATGRQGGAVARHLIQRRIAVRALTRNVTSGQAKALGALGANLVQGDLNDPASLQAALSGVDAVFSVQDFWAKGVGYAGEVQQGKNLADAAKRAGVAHFVQSGMAKGEQIAGIEHFESKAAIGEHLRAIGLPHTIIGTVYFMDNMLDAKQGGAMTFPTLAGSLRASVALHMLCVDDLGAIAAHILTHRGEFLGQHIDVASDVLTLAQMKRIYLDTSGKKPKSWALPAWALRWFNADFAKQLAWQNNPGWHFSLDQSRMLHPKLSSFAQFIKRHQIQNL